ncbi:unnamed protein product [Cyclocybe aegerita]|uniref:Protein-S-isoprenylcysteine O-methyltransferase n=1 Tax=Cyclocybe aegerita TaxID=1973307 RepID=A0A8S0W580_CYCAE|nr:unnamed protein product [Cyclocybe aegerita]
MTLSRVLLVTIQAIANGLVCTPPNPTPQKQRYHTEQMYILQIAPFIFKCHQIIAYCCAAFEILYYLSTTLAPSLAPSLLKAPLSPYAQSTLTTLTCPLQRPGTTAPPYLSTTPTLCLGVLAVALGAYIRLDCYKTLGNLFTFDLTLDPHHRLITTRFYRYVRHPAYTGSMLLVAGLTLAHLTQGSWMTECGPLARSRVSGVVVWATWWLWTFCCGISRADAEDKQMRKVFREEWDTWAKEVPWWFLPGLV